MNKIAIVTGATGGIGKALVDEFSKEGYSVIGFYGKNALEAARIRQQTNADMIAADITEACAVEDAVKTVLKKYGKIDVLINNAGIAQQKLFSDLSPQEISLMLDTNLKGAMLVTKAVIPSMVGAKSGRIINISSVWGVFGGSCEAHYSASKAGLIGFSKALSRELGLSGITVNCIAPGMIDTHMNDCIADKSCFLEQTSLQKIGKPQDVAYLAAYLASDKADYITGQVIGVDGGI